MNLGGLLPDVTVEVNFEDDPLVAHPHFAESLSPFAFWRFEEGVGTTAADSSGNSRDGAYQNTPTLGAAGAFSSTYGDIGSAVELNGTDEYVNVTGSAAWRDLHTNGWTISAWIYPTATRTSSGSAAAGILTYNLGNGSSHPFFLHYGRGDAFAGGHQTNQSPTGNHVWGGFVNAGTARFVTDPTAISSLNRWYHYAVTFDPSSLALSMYRDGVLVATVTAGGAAAAGSSIQDVRAGFTTYTSSAPTSPYFPGRLDEMLVRAVPSTAVEMTNLYRYLAVNTPDPSNYVDLSSRFRTAPTRRGRSDNTSRVEAGTAGVVLDNRDGALSEDPVVNRLPNPSLEYNDVNLPFAVTGGGTKARVARTAPSATHGNWRWRLTAPASGSAGTTALETRRSGLVGMRPGEQVTFSAYIEIPSGIGITASEVTVEILDSLDGTTFASTTQQAATVGSEARVSVTRTIRDDAVAAYARVALAHSGVNTELIYVDSVQLQEGALSDYCDGDQPDCSWGGEPHRSMSKRKTAEAPARNQGMPMRPCRITATLDAVTYPVFTGYIERYDYDPVGYGADEVCALRLADGTRILAAQSMRGFSRSAERVGDRLRAIFAYAGIPDTSLDIDDNYIDTRTLAAQATISDDTSANTLVRRIEETERGVFFVAADGTYTYQGSLVRSVEGPEAFLFTDTTEGVNYSSFTAAIDVADVVNDENIENVPNGTDYRYVSALSQARFFPVSSSEQSYFSVNEVARAADRSAPYPFTEGVEIRPLRNPAALFPVVLGLELGALGRLVRTHAGRDILNGYMQTLEGVEHEITPTNWVTRFRTSPAPIHPLVADPWQTPITKPILLTSGSQAGGDATAASKTYTAGRLYVLFVYGRRTDGTAPSQPTVASTNTWNSERQDTSVAVGSTAHRWSAYSCVAGSTVTEALGINFVTDPTDATVWFVVEINTGFNVADPVGATNYPGTGDSFNGSIDVGTLAAATSIVLVHSWKDGALDGSEPSYSGAVLFEHRKTSTGGDTNSCAYSRVPGVDTIGFSYVQAGGWGHQAVEVKAA